MGNQHRAIAAVIPLLVAPLLVTAAWTPAAFAQPATATAPAPMTASEANALAQNVTRKVIVVLKDQVPQAPAAPGTLSTPEATSRPSTSTRS